VLTKKQRDLLLFIHDKMKDGDVPPSFEEMKLALNLKSKSGIHRLITALVERGYLIRMPHRARALEIKKLPEGFRPRDEDTSAPARLAREIANTNIAAIASTFAEVPLLGRIAAGTPIEAIRHEGQSVGLPADMIGRGEHYALTVDGDSMVKAGIHDHDTVIIKRCDTAENGTIVVALVDDQEVTLKRLRRAGSKIVLEPENDAYEPRVLEPHRVKIQGRLAGLMRSYH
jgi:repressor LexA